MPSNSATQEDEYESDAYFDTVRDPASCGANAPRAGFFQIPEFFTRNQSRFGSEAYGADVGGRQAHARRLLAISGVDLASVLQHRGFVPRGERGRACLLVL